MQRRLGKLPGEPRPAAAAGGGRGGLPQAAAEQPRQLDGAGRHAPHHDQRRRLRPRWLVYSCKLFLYVIFHRLSF